jgi:hypothetical protein
MVYPYCLSIERYATVVDSEITRGDHRGAGVSRQRDGRPRGLAIQLSQGLDRQSLSPEGAPPILGMRLSRASLPHVCIRGILCLVAAGVNHICYPPLIIRETPDPRDGKSKLENDVHVRQIREARLAVRS